MKILKYFFLLLFLPATYLHGQHNILDRPDILMKVENCLYHTYGYNFDKATRIQKDLEKSLPAHPATHFLKALIIYWENFPMLPDDPKLPLFEASIEKTVELSSQLIEYPEGKMEGIFFDMHARAFRAMFWADNGKLGKVISDLDNMYRRTIEGIDYKKVFAEFYFSSGLYNYYVEAYAEKHPMYRPILSLFREGNKELGLIELQIAIDKSTYIKYEALLFMSLLQLNYERDIAASLKYMQELHDLFPDNIYYTGQYLILLLYTKQYKAAAAVNSKLKYSIKDFNKIIYHMTEGFLNENQKRDFYAAKKNYKFVIESYEKFGPITELYTAIAYAGLGRIAKKEGRLKDASKYNKKSSQYSYYDFILDF